MLLANPWNFSKAKSGVAALLSSVLSVFNTNLSASAPLNHCVRDFLMTCLPYLVLIHPFSVVIDWNHLSRTAFVLHSLFRMRRLTC